jgi:hypothetical protein
MIQEVKIYLDGYLEWLKDKTILKEKGGWVEVTTPFLDRHNDCVQIYVRANGNVVQLSDDGNTIRDLQANGCDITSKKRMQILKTTLNGFGVQLNGITLEVSASSDSFPLKKHNLVQAILAVNDMFYLAAATVTSLFFEDVSIWMEENAIRFVPHAKFTGKSGYDQKFDFVIPGLKSIPERFIQTINRPNRDKANSILLSWIDTKESRPPSSTAYAFINDSDVAVQPAIMDAFKNYDMKPVLWSRRDDVKDELAA